MNVSCEVILDLIPLVKDNVASEDSIELVGEHLKSCESCKLEFENYALPIPKEIDDKRVVSSIKKKLLLITSALLFIGASIGMAINGKASSNLVPALFAIIGIVSIGILILKFDIKGDGRVKRFFIGKAIGTIIIFAALGIFLLLKYVLHLF